MLSFDNQLAKPKILAETTTLQRQIDATPPKAEQIDQLVYDLYGLTYDKIRIVEERPSNE